jgi:hypothetical protein
LSAKIIIYTFNSVQKNATGVIASLPPRPVGRGQARARPRVFFPGEAGTTEGREACPSDLLGQSHFFVRKPRLLRPPQPPLRIHVAIKNKMATCFARAGAGLAMTNHNLFSTLLFLPRKRVFLTIQNRYNIQHENLFSMGAADNGKKEK